MTGTVFYLILNAFRIYIFIRFFDLFLKQGRAKWWIFVSCAIYFAVNSAVYLFVNIDRLTLAINVFGMLIIALAGYQGRIVKKVIAVFACLGVAVLAEDMAWVIFLKGKENQAIEFAFFWTIFFLYLLEIVIEKTVKMRKEANFSSYKGGDAYRNLCRKHFPVYYYY